jgi:hypothetical protein
MITQSQLKEVIKYDPNTGVFAWAKSRPGAKKGSVAGVKLTSRYIQIMIYRHKYSAHRLAWLYVHGEFPKKQIDHIDGNPSNNCISNLRDVDQCDNAKNQKLYCTNTSGAAGVYVHKLSGKWYAQIKICGTNTHLGFFSTFDDAVSARSEAETLNGYHKNHGAVR